MWSHTGISFDTYKDHQNGPRHEDRVLPMHRFLRWIRSLRTYPQRDHWRSFNQAQGLPFLTANLTHSVKSSSCFDSTGRLKPVTEVSSISRQAYVIVISGIRTSVALESVRFQRRITRLCVRLFIDGEILYVGRNASPCRT